ncbi:MULTISPECIES: triose-phosphate isomerase [unclassified Paraburkholderia]|uniref:triose-phosphate isomerase n=1 Tax=unclassified Paraburkholderia TaxID=2615204 RepID=UPI002AAF4DAE|nr:MULTISPECIES: triose-phosphate isomerase [unclassified Paraburkholderia]
MSRERKLVVGNWKLNGNLAENAARLSELRGHGDQAFTRVQIAVCVPFPYLSQAQNALQGSHAAWGVQDVSAHLSGAYTGETSAVMAAEFGASFAIVGHSERRSYHGERSETIAAKVKRAVESGLTPILCVGETIEQRDASETTEVVSAQLIEVLEELSTEQQGHIVFAYEPVWAIGTGRTASPGQAQEVHAHIRRVLAAVSPELKDRPILYGGSVKAGNAEELFMQEDIDGALVGGASLVSTEFAGICSAAQRTCAI